MTASDQRDNQIGGFEMKVDRSDDILSRMTRTAQVRRSFSQEAEWRPALTGHIPLLVFSTPGPIDAPERVPAGCAAGRSYVATIHR